MDISRHLKLVTVLLTVFLAAGCTNTPAAPVVLSPVNLKPYGTATLAVLPSAPVNATEIPLPSPTPSTYSVVSGDSLGTIAEQLGVSLADLQTANPGVVSESMTVGQKINIPSKASTIVEPAQAELGPVQCHPAGAGTYCFVAVHNTSSAVLENVKLQMSVLGPKGKVVDHQEAFLPLNILPPGDSLPAYTLFAELPAGTIPIAQLSGSIALFPEDQRYLPAVIHNLLINIDWDGRSARAQGQVFLPAGAKAQSAATIWLAAVAYDASGQVVGFRRWEWQGSLKPGNAQGFDFSVYSLGPAIETVDVVVEARP